MTRDLYEFTLIILFCFPWPLAIFLVNIWWITFENLYEFIIFSIFLILAEPAYSKCLGPNWLWAWVMNLQKEFHGLTWIPWLDYSAKNKQKLNLKNLWPHQYENMLSMVMSGCVELWKSQFICDCNMSNKYCDWNLVYWQDYEVILWSYY